MNHHTSTISHHCASSSVMNPRFTFSPFETLSLASNCDWSSTSWSWVHDINRDGKVTIYTSKRFNIENTLLRLKKNKDIWHWIKGIEWYETITTHCKYHSLVTFTRPATRAARWIRTSSSSQKWHVFQQLITGGMWFFACKCLLKDIQCKKKATKAVSA